MKRSLRRWQALLPPLLCLLGWALPVQSVHAAVSCTATMSDVSFGSVDLVNNSGTITSGSLSYNCTNTDRNNAVQVNICLAVDGGQNSQSQLNPSRMLDSGNPSNVLNFNLYLPDGVTPWGSSLYGTQPYNPPVFIVPKAPNRTTPGSAGGGPITMPARLVNGQNAVLPNTGANTYRDSFSAGSTSIGFAFSNVGSSPPASCGANQPIRFPFLVSATVIKSCTVTAGSDIDLGAVGFLDTNLAGSNTIGVSCSRNTPYFVGLSPSNGSTVGAGLMSGTGGNADKVPYQLRSVSATGQIWGNTATAVSVGNGVAGNGTGANQSIPVFATVPSANVTPDSYADTVTVIVNY